MCMQGSIFGRGFTEPYMHACMCYGTHEVDYVQLGNAIANRFLYGQCGLASGSH